MPFEVIDEFFDGAVKVIQTVVFDDDRGFFLEAYRQDHFRELGITDQIFVQDNHSRSRKDVVRGLHFQWDAPMAKLMRVTVGSALLFAVDVRKGSPTLGEHVAIEASAENHIQLFAPFNFARGFCVTSDIAEIQYKCTSIYNPATEGAIRWSDPDIGIDIPAEEPILSPKDAVAPTLAEWLTTPAADMMRYRG